MLLIRRLTLKLRDICNTNCGTLYATLFFFINFFNVQKSSNHIEENTSKNETETTKKAAEPALIEVKRVYIVSESEIHIND